MTVLDLLEHLRAGGAPVPAYRHSCHHGSCGTCGAVVNGLEALMCLTRIADLALPRPRIPGGQPVEPDLDGEGRLVVTLEPLSRMTVLSGIAVVPGRVFEGIPAEASYLAAVEDAGRSPLPQDPEGAAVHAGRSAWRPAGRVRFEACIECGLCVSACPVAVPFIGPAALAAVNREREKRPERAMAMLEIAAAPEGVGPCGRHLACSRVCPQAVYPGKHIQLLRNALATAETDM
jgi:succinate dehydrogenase / fumarate reductase iron-sulfur subunit